jgi:hypothetical protein
MKEQRPLSERIIWSIKNNRILACIIVFGSIVIALGIFTDATKKIIDAMGGERPEEARAKLAQIKLPFEPAIFFECVEKGDIDAVNLFLAAGMNPNTENKYGLTVLTHAVQQNHRHIIDALLKAKANVNGTTKMGWGPVSSAARPDRKDILLTLLKHSPDTKSLNAAFVSAASYGDRDMMEMLIKRGADIVTVLDGASTIEWALENTITDSATSVTEKDRNDVVKYLLSLSVDVNVRYRDSYTPLLLAVANGLELIAKTLVESGADPNVRWECNCLYSGMTPLMFAVKRSPETNIAKILLDNGADINAKLINPDHLYKAGSTALMLSICKSELAEILISRNAELSMKNDEGQTALLLAASCSDSRILKILIDKGLDINQRDNKGDTPLMYASQFYEVANVRILLDKGADINRKNTNGATALIYAADDYYCSRTDHVRALLENGADINAMTNEGKTALMMAAHQGCFDTVKHLLDRGAAVRQKDIYGKTAQDFAEKSKLTGEEREKMLWLLKTAIKPTSRSSSKPAKQLR